MKTAILSLFFVCTALAVPPSPDGAIELLATGNRLFTSAVFKETLKTNTPNIIFSPLSAVTVLSLTSEGARGETKSELIKALHLTEENEKNQEGFKLLLPKLRINTDNTKLLSANKVYADNDITLEDDFKKIAVDVYRSEIENVNFSENIASAAKINRWVEDQTNEKIKNLIEPDQIDEDTALVLVNALYMSSKWFNAFPAFGTRSQKFYKTSTDSTDVQMMHNVAYFNYYENKDLNTQFIELKFKHEGLSMVIALHKEIEGISSLETNLEEVFKPQPWEGEFVDVKLPKFTISSSINFVRILQSLEVKKIFDAASADLTGLSANRKNLFVSNIIQKAFINVTETGTEAAAASAVMVQTRSGHMIRPKKIFLADHPYIFYIKYYDVILFAGKYSS